MRCWKTTKIEISNFKMLENAPYETPDIKAYVGLLVQAMGEEEKIYGPVFTTRLINHALRYVAQKFGEKTPEDIKSLDQLGKYLISVSDKYPTAYQTFLYAQYKTENEFQGQTGAGARVGAIGFFKDVAKSPSGEKRRVDLDNLLSTYRRTGIAMKVAAVKFGYKNNEDGSVDALWPVCHFRDTCRFTFEEGLLKRPDGRMHCNLCIAMVRFFKLATSYEWDYELLEIYKPHCIARVYIV